MLNEPKFLWSLSESFLALVGIGEGLHYHSSLVIWGGGELFYFELRYNIV